MFAQPQRFSAFTRRSIATAAVAVAMTITGSARAVDGNWIKNDDEKWKEKTNWSTDPSIPGIPAGADDIARFLNRGGGNNNTKAVTVTIDGDADVSLKHIFFENNHNYTIDAADGRKLVFKQGTVGILKSPLIQTKGPAGYEIKAPVHIEGDNLSIQTETTGGGTLTLSGVISSANGKGLRKVGAGTAILSAANTFTGSVNVFEGWLIGMNNSAFGDTTGKTIVDFKKPASVGLLGGLGAIKEKFMIAGHGVSTDGNVRGALVSLGGNNTITADGAVILNSNTSIGAEGAPGDVFTINAVISSNNNQPYQLNKVGDRRLDLGNKNTYTGKTFVKTGVLGVRADGALGTTRNGTEVNADAQIDLVVNYKTAEEITVSGQGLSATLLGALAAETSPAGSTVTFAGPIKLKGDGGNLASVGAVGNRWLVLPGNISDAAGAPEFRTLGGGTVVLDAVNDHKGQTSVWSGTLHVKKDGALGKADGTDATRTRVTAGETLALGVNYTKNEKLALNGGGRGGLGALHGITDSSWNGQIELESASSVGADDRTTLALNKPIAGAAKLTKIGAGTVSLDAKNTYTGGTDVDAGYLTITSDEALGSGAGAATVKTGATLVFSGGVNYLKDTQQINIAGAGVDGKIGAIHAVGKDNKFSGKITLTDNATISTAADSTLKILPAVRENGKKLTQSPGARGKIELDVLKAAAPFDTTDTEVIVDGEGTVVMPGPSDYDGPTTVRQGTLLVNGQIAPSSVYHVNVEPAAVLGGTGVIARNVTAMPGAIVSAGDEESDPTGDLTVAALHMLPDAVLHTRIDGSQVSTIHVTGLSLADADITGAFLEIDDSSTPIVGMEYTLIDRVGGAPLSGLQYFDPSEGFGMPLADDSVINTPGGLSFILDYNGGLDGLDVVLRATAVPEPASLGAGLALSMLALRRRRQS